MKRLTLILLTFAIAIGVFAPVGLALTGEGASFGISTVSAQTATSTTITLAANPQDQIASCANLTTGFSFGACVTWAVYYIPYTVGDWLLALSARAFDIAASFTLSSKLYTSGTFLQQGWQITRDFANIFFILILLFIALSLVLDIEIGHANPKKMLATLIMVALVINFSFFITEVVIDLSNSLALVFYNQVSVVGPSANGTLVTDTDPSVNQQLQQYAQGTNAAGQPVQYIQSEKPLSVALVSAMKPQILSDANFYNDLCNVGTNGFFGNPGNSASCTASGTSPTAATSTMLIAIFLLVGIMFIVLAYCFVVALAALFGRMISLFIAIVFAPIAFVSLIVPSMRGMPGFGWDEWFRGLIANAFAAPIFFFFILIISILSKSTIIPKNLNGLSPGVILILVSVQFLILITLMLKATTYMKEASGAIGNAMGGFAGNLASGLGKIAAGVTVGTALGTVAVAGRATIGEGGNKLANSEKFTDWAANGNKLQRFIGKGAINLGTGAASASFNASKGLSTATGLNFNGLGPTSQKNTEGGFTGKAERDAKKDLAFSEKLKENQSQAAALKKLKDSRDGQVEKQERQIRLAEQELENSKALLQAQKDAKSDAKEAMEQMTKRGDPDVVKNSDDYKALLKKYDAADALINGKETKDAQGNVIKNASYNNAVEKIRKDIAEKKKALQNIKDGDRDPKDLEQRKITKEDVESGDPARYTKADGSRATMKDVGRAVRATDLSIKDLENLIESNKKANAKAYLYNKAVDSGYHVHGDFDKQGNVKSFHIDSKKAGEQNMTKAVTRGLGKAAVGTAIGFAVAGPIGAAIGAGFGGLTQVLREELMVSAGNKRGSSYSAAEAAHHTADSSHAGSHGDGHGGAHGNQGAGPLSEIQSVLASSIKSLLSGGKGGGGGGGHSGGGGHGGGGGHH